MGNLCMIVLEDGHEIGTVRPLIPPRMAIAGTPMRWRARVSETTILAGRVFGKAGDEKTFDRLDEAWGWLRDETNVREPDEGLSG